MSSIIYRWPVANLNSSEDIELRVSKQVKMTRMSKRWWNQEVKGTDPKPILSVDGHQPNTSCPTGEDSLIS